MADTRPDVVVAPNQWTNLYSVTGIMVGTAVDIWNKGSNNCDIAIKATAPTVGTGTQLWVGPIGSHISVTAGETGLWAYSTLGTRLLIQEL